MLSSYRMIRTPGTRKGSTPWETRAIRVLLTDDLALVDPPPRCHACDSEEHLLCQCPLGKKILDAVKSASHKFGLAKKKSKPRNSKGANGVNAIHDQSASGN